MFMCKLLIRFPFINDYIPVINLTEREYGIKSFKSWNHVRASGCWKGRAHSEGSDWAVQMSMLT